MSGIKDRIEVRRLRSKASTASWVNTRVFQPERLSEFLADYARKGAEPSPGDEWAVRVESGAPSRVFTSAWKCDKSRRGGSGMHLGPAIMHQTNVMFCQRRRAQDHDQSEGITANVRTWRADIPGQIAGTWSSRKPCSKRPTLMFSPCTSRTTTRGQFICRSQSNVQLERLRSGLRGTAATCGRVLTCKAERRKSP
jgi:hypothetical protein